ncbi:uncharacterized protein LOC143147639 [Ptiloglossa arizonensis]|uniref:uncharacterized protein LOC143147639 n=1 Tax=Ptiloglossa arizonensis TaxID=3350558 RepID=UPI003FA18C3B
MRPRRVALLSFHVTHLLIIETTTRGVTARNPARLSCIWLASIGLCIRRIGVTNGKSAKVAEETYRRTNASQCLETNLGGLCEVEITTKEIKEIEDDTPDDEDRSVPVGRDERIVTEMPTNALRGKVFGPVSFILLVLTMSTCRGITTTTEQNRYRQRGTPMHKVQLTQKGYIQFLRWELPVPELTEFTFCLWLESNDLTHPHSIFSYSKNERDRLVRAWISSHGRSVHLEIGGTTVFATPTDIHENRWYHVCQSWENQAGLYALWVNGHLWVQGRSEKTVGHVIPSGGDIVVGQEYTDFDKGLEDGIEGSVLGFNLLLASAFDPRTRNNKRESSVEAISMPSSVSSYATVPLFARIPPNVMQRDVSRGTRTIYAVFPSIYGRRVRRYASLQPRTSSRDTELASETINPWLLAGRIARSKLGRNFIPLGLQLVKLSHVRCEIGRGSPFLGGPLMLISWTRTPVRVFGGAILKNVKNHCGNF